MQTRPVPRNIDRPNRLIEFVVTFMVFFYGVQFLTSSIMLSYGVSFFAVYMVYRLTLDKPEGMFYRLLYKSPVRLGKMMPSPRHANRFNI